jgi:hypothetical protein
MPRGCSIPMATTSRSFTRAETSRRQTRSAVAPECEAIRDDRDPSRGNLSRGTLACVSFGARHGTLLPVGTRRRSRRGTVQGFSYAGARFRTDLPTLCRCLGANHTTDLGTPRCTTPVSDWREWSTCSPQTRQRALIVGVSFHSPCAPELRVLGRLVACPHLPRRTPSLG